MLYKVGVTGSICSGKSACVKLLGSLPHSYKLNFDELGHTVYKRNPFLINKIKRVYLSLNENIIKNNNTFYEEFIRKELGNIVFYDKKSLDLLNGIVHPEMRKCLKIIIDRLERTIQLKNEKAILFVEGAIILEGNLQNFFDEIWLTTCSLEETEKRFYKRLTDENVKEYEKKILDNILKNQWSNEKKAKFCNEIIDTNSDFNFTKEKYIDLYKKLINKLNIEQKTL